MTDLACLCPPGRDLFEWAEEHLRAVVDKPFPTLVPARGANNHCHWLFEGRCVVHENAPYSCAFFDSHQSESELSRRSAATILARKDDAATNGLYYRVWRHLQNKGLIGPSGDRDALADDVRKIQQNGKR